MFIHYCYFYFLFLPRQLPRFNCLGCLNGCYAFAALNFQKCAAIKKKSLWFQSIPFYKYPYTLGILDNICFHFKLNAKNGGLVLPPSTFQSGEGNCPQLLAHEVVLVKFELQIHTEHLSSCWSGFLVVFVLLNFTFLCIRNFLLVINYLYFCNAISVYLYHICY